MSPLEIHHLIFWFQILLLAVKQIFPDFEFLWLVDEAKKNLPLELDFLNEGRNAEKVAHMLKCFDFLKVIGLCACGSVYYIETPVHPFGLKVWN